MVAKGSLSDGDEANEPKKILVDKIKSNFFEQGHRIVLTIYIKNLDHDQTTVQFNETSIILTFKTSDVTFLKQYNADSAGVLFEWTIELTNRIDVMESKFKINKSTMELILNKHISATQKWSNVIKSKEDCQLPKVNEMLKNLPPLGSRSVSPPPPPQPTAADKVPEKQAPAEPSPEYSFYGYTGLQNLGNTCYMNAAIQCLVNLTDLRDYFIETPAIFQKDINTSNALGLNGKMAISFAMLLRKLWKSNLPHMAPSQLRDLVCAKYAHFRGYEQQDTQEFMCSLLSILHEDLNRIGKKPFYESNLECNSDTHESCSAIANDSWLRFLTRENSIITDNFYGQFKSKLTCPKCSKVSITFEPFSNFLIPLPTPKQSHLCLLVTKKQQLLRLKLFVSENETVAEALKNLKKRYDIFASKHLRMFIVNKKSIERDDGSEMVGFSFNQNWNSIPSNQTVPKLKVNQLFIIYEVEDNSNELVFELRVQQVCKYPEMSSNALSHCSFCKKPALDVSSDENSSIDKQRQTLARCTRCFRSAYCNAECQKSDWKRHSLSVCCKDLDVVGLPFVICLRERDITNKSDFEELLNKRLFEESIGSADIYNFATNKFELNQIDFVGDARVGKRVGANDLFDALKAYLDEGSSEPFDLNLELKWYNLGNNNDNASSKKNLLKIETNLDRLQDFSNQDKKSPSSNIHDCIKLFTEPEVLTEDNPWYCSSCKEHQKATKQMSLWKLSKYLMITLKRFHSNKASDAPQSSNIYLNYLIQNRLAYNKLNTFIDYPIRGLNMSQYVTDIANKTNYIYDLCGVINHIGQSLYLGHYTAFSRTHNRKDSNKDELGWRLFDDSHVQTVNNLDHIVTQDAYVLVYRLRDNAGADTLGDEPQFSAATSNQDKLASSPQASDGEDFNLNSDESEELNSNSNASSESLEVQLDNKSSFTNLNDLD